LQAVAIDLAESAPAPTSLVVVQHFDEETRAVRGLERVSGARKTDPAS
jgi:hypothetical protein